MEHSTNPAENEVQKPNTKQTPTGRPATRADVKSLSEQRQKEGYGGEHGTQQLCEPETPHGCQFWRSHVVQRNCQCLCSARMQGGPPAWHRGLKSWHGSSCDLGVDYSSADPWPRNSMCQTEKRRKEKKKSKRERACCGARCTHSQRAAAMPEALPQEQASHPTWDSAQDREGKSAGFTPLGAGPSTDPSKHQSEGENTQVQDSSRTKTSRRLQRR